MKDDENPGHSDIILEDFVTAFIKRYKVDTERPLSKIDKGDIKRVIKTWAEAVA